MWFNILVLFTALTISGVAAYYSIVGLTAIFASAFWSIVIMGTVLELGKIVASVWLKRHWHQAAWQLKTYLTFAVAVLMLITSLGIFGFLSRAHLEQSMPAGEVAAKLEILDAEIAIQKDNIAQARASLAQLDEQVNQRLSRGTSEQGAERAVTIRRQQARERAQLQQEIVQAQKQISELSTERAPIATELRKVETEVGPIKYVAALIYGDNPDANLLERAVRWMIIIIVLVFDPLAIALILAANSSIRWEREKLLGLISTPVPEPEPEPEKLSPVVQNSEPEPGLDEPHEDFRSGPADADQLPPQVYLKRPFVHFPKSAPMVAMPDPIPDPAPAPEPVSEAPVETSSDTDTDLDSSHWENNEFQKNSTVSFGTQFPSQPRKADQFLRVDYFPSRLFKFNGSKWIWVNKENSDVWLTDDKYLDFLIEQIAAGKIVVEDLGVAEQELVAKRLKSKIQNEK
jgi:hypothetical protein